MKFGETLRRELIPEWRPHYVDYDGLKEVIKGCSETEFMEQLDKEQDKVDQFIRGQIAELVNAIRFYEREVEQVEESTLEEIGSKICTIDAFVFQNKEGFRKIAKKFAKKTGNSIAWFKRSEANSVLHRAGGVVHELIVMLSACWAAFKAIASAKGTAPTDAWIPPATFSRKTTKYWVHPSDISRLKVFVLKHVPILEMNKSRKVELGFEKQKLSQTHNFISSVYLDSNDFDCYHARIRQDEGAQLLRVRWYGGEIDDDARRRTTEVHHEKHLPGSPGGTAGAVPTPRAEDRFLFIERKTHHEKWYGPNPSIKERFQLKRKRIEAFMDGTLDVKQELERMVEKGQLKQDQLEASVRVAQECQEMVKTQKMTPKIRTSCHRTAFQEKTNNQVRLSLDFPLYLFKETKGTAPSFWDILDSPVGLEPFPYGVLEIKTSADDAPEWVTELLATGWLTQVHKFSKYQHSIATNFPERLEILPYWIASVGDDDSVNRNFAKEDPEGSRRLVEIMDASAVRSATSVDPRIVAAAPPDLPSLRSAGPPGPPGPPGAPAILPDAQQNSKGTISSSTPRSQGRVIAEAGSCKTTTTSPDHTALQMPTPPQSPERAPNQRRRRPGSVAPAARPLSQGTVAVKQASLKRTKVKVDAKTYFANERTFIQWLGAALFLVTLASAMMATGKTGRVMGTIFFPVGIFFLVYALYTFHWRLKLIKNAGVGGRFDDPYGPAVLTVGVLISLLAVLIFVWTEETPADVVSDASAWDSGMVCGSTCDRLDRYTCSPPALATTAATVRTSAALQIAWDPSCMATLALRARSADMIFAAIAATSKSLNTKINTVSGFHGCMDVFLATDAPAVEYELPVRQTYCVRVSGDAPDAPCRMVEVVEATGTLMVTDSAADPAASLNLTGSAFNGSTALSVCGPTESVFAGATIHVLSMGAATNAIDLVTRVGGAGATLQLVNSSHGMRYQHDMVIAGTPATLSLLVEYGSEIDRRVGRNPNKVMLRLEFPSTPTFTSHHHANVAMKFLSFLAEEATSTPSSCRSQ